MTYPRRCQIINASSTVSDADAYSFAQALNQFLQQTFGPVWDLDIDAEFCSVKSPPSPGSVPIDPAKYGIYLIDGTGPSGVGGEHFHANGQSYAEIWLGAVGERWPEFAAHEAEETAVNPLNNLLASGAGGGPGIPAYIAVEVCDAVEHQPVYVTGPDGRTWAMENFCTPNYFVQDGVAPFDYLGSLSQPLTHQPGGRYPQ